MRVYFEVEDDLEMLEIEVAMVRRLAQLWGVAPYRVDVQKTEAGQYFIYLDGSKPPQDLIQVFEDEVQSKTKEVNNSLN